MQFQQVIGQAHIKQQLIKMIQGNRLSHALLFLGKEGSGALPLAIAFANYLCLPKEDQEPNQNQESDLFGNAPDVIPQTLAQPATPDQIDEWMPLQPAWPKLKAMVHPDIHFSYPVIPRKPGDKPISTDYIKEWREFILTNPCGNLYDWLQFIDAENKQGNITAHECNDIIHKMSLKSFESEYKILIMWMPEMLGKEGNKLLKLIEEPPPNTLFIFVAENDSFILPTILSRLQLIKIPALTNEEIDAALQQNNTPANKARQIAGVCNGNYREALQMLQHTEDDWETLFRSWLNAIAKNAPVTQVKWIDEISKIGREKQKQFLKYANHLLQQAIRLRVMGNAENRPQTTDNGQPHSADFALRLNKICDISQQQAIITELDSAAYFVERNANAKILFHALTIKLSHIIHNKSVILMK